MYMYCVNGVLQGFCPMEKNLFTIGMEKQIPFPSSS